MSNRAAFVCPQVHRAISHFIGQRKKEFRKFKTCGQWFETFRQPVERCAGLKPKRRYHDTGGAAAAGMLLAESKPTWLKAWDLYSRCMLKDDRNPIIRSVCVHRVRRAPRAAAPLAIALSPACARACCARYSGGHRGCKIPRYPLTCCDIGAHVRTHACRYAPQLFQWMQMFPPHRLLVVQSEELYQHPHRVMARVTKHMGLRAHTAGEKANFGSVIGSKHISDVSARLALRAHDEPSEHEDEDEHEHEHAAPRAAAGPAEAAGGAGHGHGGMDAAAALVDTCDTKAIERFFAPHEADLLDLLSEFYPAVARRWVRWQNTTAAHGAQAGGGDPMP